MRPLPFITLALALASVLAQEPLTATTFLYAPRLEVTPATLLASPGYTTLLELFAPVEEQFTGNTGLVDIKVGGNLVVLFPKAKSGETDLILRAKGRTMLFRVQVKEGGSPRRYVIREEAPPPLTSPPTHTIPTTAALLEEGLAVSAGAEAVPEGLKLQLEVRSATIYPVVVRTRQAQALVAGEETPFRVSGGDVVLMPLKAASLSFVFPGKNAVELLLPLEVSGKALRLRVVARPQGVGLSLERKAP